jgi:hypothetical protein
MTVNRDCNWTQSYNLCSLSWNSRFLSAVSLCSLSWNSRYLSYWKQIPTIQWQCTETVTEDRYLLFHDSEQRVQLKTDSYYSLTVNRDCGERQIPTIPWQWWNSRFLSAVSLCSLSWNSRYLSSVTVSVHCHGIVGRLQLKTDSYYYMTATRECN